METTARPSRHPDVAASEVLDELVLFVPGADRVVSLNSSARAIFEHCDGVRTLGEICAALASLVGRAPAELEVDVRAAIAQLLELGVLTMSPQPG